MNIFITGGTGLIGKHLCQLLQPDHKITVLTRACDKAKQTLGPNIAVINKVSDIDFNAIDCVINLAGEPIVNKRWSDKQKQRLHNSRIELTAQLSSAIKSAEHPPSVFISGSAIGYYGRQSTEIIDEDHTGVHDEFSHQLCQRWEQAALSAQSSKTRVCILRTGIVLAKDQGALAKMLPPFKLALGGPIGDGNQGMSWVHIEDMVALIKFIIENDAIHGPINATAPNPVSNKVFSQQLGNAINRPAKLTMPAWFLSLLMGEMAELLIYGQYVVPTKLLNHGYNFRYTHLPEAFNNLINKQ